MSEQNWPKNPLLQLLILEIAKAIISFLVKHWGLDSVNSGAKEEIFSNLKASLRGEKGVVNE